MFEFITVSNGEIVVRHIGEGHVYRFRPLEPGDWTRLVQSRTDIGLAAQSSAQNFDEQALRFATVEADELGMTVA